MAAVIGYLSDSLPKTAMTQMDSYVLERIFPRFRMLRSRSQSVAQKLFGTLSNRGPVGVEGNISEAREKRRQSLERFILTLSDQQLATGLAVMVAGLARRCSMSIYHFNIVSSLAWLSSTTHLATLGMLREYFAENTSVRNWRITGMVALLGLLLYSQPIMFSQKDISLPLQCVLGYPSLYVDYSDIIVLIKTMGFLITVYTRRIMRLFVADPDWSISWWVVRVLVRVLPGGQRQLSPARPFEEALSTLDIIERGKIIRAERELRSVRQHQKFLHINRKSRFRSYSHALIFVIEESSFSYLSQFFTLWFDFIYSVDQTIIFRLSPPAQGVSGDQNTMGFGQLVPLFLLVLPCFTVFELYFGKNYAFCDIHGFQTHSAHYST